MMTNHPQSLMLMYFLKFLWPTLMYDDEKKITSMIMKMRNIIIQTIPLAKLNEKG